MCTFQTCQKKKLKRFGPPPQRLPPPPVDCSLSPSINSVRSRFTRRHITVAHCACWPPCKGYPPHRSKKNIHTLTQSHNQEQRSISTQVYAPHPPNHQNRALRSAQAAIYSPNKRRGKELFSMEHKGEGAEHTMDKNGQTAQI